MSGKGQGSEAERNTDYKLPYRRDIDGLRAIAVLSVITFHVDENILPGGFLGVDIFFVISGYLITLLLIRGIESTCGLDLGDFYRRRIQRILPAMLFMLVGVSLAGYLLMRPEDYAALMMTVIASVLSVANIHFYAFLDTGYFAAGTGDVPLLHMWSLGVEEQFYLLWPFLVFLLVTRIPSPRMRIATILGAMTISLVFAHVMASVNQPFSYYLLPSRAWELLAGCVAAFLASRGVAVKAGFRNPATCIAFTAIIGGLALIDETHSIPGLAVVPVVFGTVILLLSPPDTIAGRLLSVKPLVAIGLVSYSAYLWHWPVLALLRYSYIEISWLTGAIAVIATLLIATVSYRYVEKPLRQLRRSKRDIFIRYLAVPGLVIAAFASSIVLAIQYQMPGLYPWESYHAVAQYTQASLRYDYNCQHHDFSVNDLSDSRCIYPEGSQPTVLLLGDSNAAHYLGMMRSFAAHYGFSIRNASQSACPFLLTGDVDWVAEKYSSGCRQYLKVAGQELDEYDTVIIGGSWTTYDRRGRQEFRNEIADTIEELSRRVKNVVILAKAPVFYGYRGDCEARSVRIFWIRCAEQFVTADRNYSINSYLRGIAQRHANVLYFDVRHLLCRGGECSPYIDGIPVYSDHTHFSMEGSAAMADLMVRTNDATATSLRVVLGAGTDALEPEIVAGEADYSRTSVHGGAK